MSRKTSLILIFALVCAFIPLNTKAEDGIPDFCVEGIHAGNAEYLICVPDNWNRNLIVYAHGYVAFNEPIGIPWDQLIFPDGTSIPEIMTALGFAFATTSYSTNGLAVQEGLAEVINLIDVFEGLYTTPEITLLGGASEGGLITTLAVEQYPDIIDGGLSTCGPIGDFREQVNYYGDFRVVFDYFFPDVLPPSPIDIPSDVIDNWELVYLPTIMETIRLNPYKTAQLLKITKAPFDLQDKETVRQTVERLLWYNTFATNDGVTKLGGNPYDNLDRYYSNSSRTRRLNRIVERFSADQVSLDSIEANYQTTGKLNIPLVTIHTTGDEVVPYWHEVLYRDKVDLNQDQTLYTHIPVIRYGHCNFKVAEVLAGFAVLLINVSGQQLEGIDSYLSPDSLQVFYNIIRDFDISR